MTIHTDPTALQIIENKERLLRERLKSNMAKQYDLQKDEADIRSELTLLDNRRANLCNPGCCGI